MRLRIFPRISNGILLNTPHGTPSRIHIQIPPGIPPMILAGVHIGILAGIFSGILSEHFPKILPRSLSLISQANILCISLEYLLGFHWQFIAVLPQSLLPGFSIHFPGMFPFWHSFWNSSNCRSQIFSWRFIIGIQNFAKDFSMLFFGIPSIIQPDILLLVSSWIASSLFFDGV